jgi:hypothetical protein
LSGAGITSITHNADYGNGYDAIIVDLSVPAGKTANMTFNVGSRGAPALVTDNGVDTNFAFDGSTGDVILTNVASTLVFAFKNSGGSSSSSSSSSSSNDCGSSGSPLIATGPVYAEIGKTTIGTAQITNTNNNVSATMSAPTYSPPAESGIQAVTKSGLPQTVGPFDTGTFQFSLSLATSVKPGEYNVSVSTPFTETCAGNTIPGQSGFTIEVIAQKQANVNTNSFPWLLFLENWWWALTIVGIVVSGSAVIVIQRDRDE